MAKLYFYYGAMGSSKTANALMTEYNYRERGQKPLLVKTSLDKRDGELIIRSRIGLEKECILLENLIEMNSELIKGYDAIIVDEVQFATPEQIDFLAYIVDELNVPVLCFGLRTDFQLNLFEGSKRLLELADKILEIKTMCWCGSKATCNARYDENGIIRNGEQVVLGSNHNYVALCRKHFLRGDLGPDFNKNL